MQLPLEDDEWRLYLKAPLCDLHFLWEDIMRHKTDLGLWAAGNRRVVCSYGFTSALQNVLIYAFGIVQSVCVFLRCQVSVFSLSSQHNMMSLSFAVSVVLSHSSSGATWARRQISAEQPCWHWPVSWRETTAGGRLAPPQPLTPPTGSPSGTASLPKVPESEPSIAH